MSLTRKQFLKGMIKTEPVTISTGDVLVRGMTTEDRLAVFESKDSGRDGDYLYLICIQCLVDDAGKCLLTVEDMKALHSLPAGDVDTIANKALELSGLSDDSRAELEKNLVTTPDSDSSLN